MTIPLQLHRRGVSMRLRQLAHAAVEQTLHRSCALRGWLVVAVILVGAVFASLPLTAADLYRDGTSGGNWSDSLWGTAPGGPYTQPWSSDSDAVFEGSAGTVNVDGTESVNSITFTTDGYTLSGSGSLSLTGSGGAITTGSASDTIAAIITGSVGLTKLGSGTLVISGANAFSGTTVIAVGVLSLGGNSLVSTPPVQIALGATLDLAGWSPTVDSLENSGAAAEPSSTAMPARRR
jgi:autotransporter-associated beta strand protein